MNERDIDAWLTMEIQELSQRQDIFDVGHGNQGERLRLAARARLMAETALTVAGVNTKSERHNLHQMLDQLRNPVSQTKAQHLDDHYADAVAFYGLTSAPKTLRNYWQSTADNHIHYHMRYAPAKSAQEKTQAASKIAKVSLILDVEMLRALHGILDESYPQCSLPYAQRASVRGHDIVLDRLVAAGRGDDAFHTWCCAYYTPVQAFWADDCDHPNIYTADALKEAIRNLKQYDDPAVRWMLLPFNQLDMWERQREKLQRRISQITVETDNQRWLDLIATATEHIDRIRQEHNAPKL